MLIRLATDYQSSKAQLVQLINFQLLKTLATGAP